MQHTIKRTLLIGISITAMTISSAHAKWEQFDLSPAASTSAICKELTRQTQDYKSQIDAVKNTIETHKKSIEDSNAGLVGLKEGLNRAKSDLHYHENNRKVAVSKQQNAENELKGLALKMAPLEMKIAALKVGQQQAADKVTVLNKQIADLNKSFVEARNSFMDSTNKIAEYKKTVENADKKSKELNTALRNASSLDEINEIYRQIPKVTAERNAANQGLKKETAI